MRTWGWIAFGVSLAMYVATAARSVQGGDVGELAMVAAHGGVPHPPGYPLWVALARVLSLVPAGGGVFRAALVSCLAGAGAVAVLQRVGAKLTGSETASLAAALAFGVSPLAWRLAGAPEVFALLALGASLVLLAAMRCAEAPSVRTAALLGVAWGAALVAHQTALFLAPVVLGVVAARRPPLVPFAGGVAAGLALFLLLPAHAWLAPPEAWVWGEPGTVRGLLRHVLRSDYGSFRLAIGDEERRPIAQAAAFLLRLPRELAGVYAVAAAAGVWVAWRKSRASTLALLAAIALAGLAFPALFNLPASPVGREVAGRFLLLPLLLVTPFVAFGLAEAERRIPGRIGVVLVFLALPAAAALAWRHADWTRDRFVERWTRAAVEPLPARSVVLVQGDLESFAFLWTLEGERFRDDVRAVDVHLLRYGWYFARAKRRVPEIGVEHDPERTRIVPLVESLHAAGVEVYATPAVAGLLGRFVVEPSGLLAPVAPAGTPRTPPAELERRLEDQTRALGEITRPIDAWSAAARASAAVPWLALAAEWEKAGDPAAAARARTRAASLAIP